MNAHKSPTNHAVTLLVAQRMMAQARFFLIDFVNYLIQIATLLTAAVSLDR